MSKYVTCKNCRFGDCAMEDYPCCVCNYKYDRWEPKERRTKMNDNVSCLNCRYMRFDAKDYPCCLCNLKYSRWAPKVTKKNLIELKNDAVASLEDLIIELKLDTCHYEGDALHTELVEAIRATWTSNDLIRMGEIATVYTDMVILRGDVADKFNKLVAFVKDIDRTARKAKRGRSNQNGQKDDADIQRRD